MSDTPAREPVAWRYRYKPARAGEKYGAWKYVDGVAEVNHSGSYEFEPLYTEAPSERGTPSKYEYCSKCDDRHYGGDSHHTKTFHEKLIELVKEWDEQPSGEAMLAGETAVLDFLHMPEVEALLACADSSTAPCGHDERYCYTNDGGKNIVCLLCEHEARTAASADRSASK